MAPTVTHPSTPTASEAILCRVAEQTAAVAAWFVPSGGDSKLGTMEASTLLTKPQPNQQQPTHQQQLKQQPSVRAPDVWSVDDLHLVLRVGAGQLERGLALAVLALHVLRTWLTVRLAQRDADLIKFLIAGDRQALVRGLLLWLALAGPACAVSAAARSGEALLARRLRHNLTAAALALYCKDIAGRRRVSALRSPPGSSVSETAMRAEDLPHQLTDDIAQCARRFAALVGSDVARPLVEVSFFSAALVGEVGFRSHVIATAACAVAAASLRLVRPPFSRTTERAAHAEAAYRRRHEVVHAAREEIAFLRGEPLEHRLLATAHERIGAIEGEGQAQRGVFDAAEEYVTKYVWPAISVVQSAAALWASSASTAANIAPAVGGGGAVAAADRAKSFIGVRRLMIRNCDAMERATLTQRSLLVTATYAGRVSRLLQGLALAEPQQQLKANDTPNQSCTCQIKATFELVPPLVELAAVDVAEPATGRVLIRQLSLRLTASSRVLLAGKSGVGKSSLLRVIAAMWPPAAGRVTTHFEAAAAAAAPTTESGVLFVPQRPYLADGLTMRELLTYPTAPPADAHALAQLDELLSAILDAVELTSTVAAIGGLGAGGAAGAGSAATMNSNGRGGEASAMDGGCCCWSRTLSGGEQQRVSLARVLFHRPRFVFLDEATSAIPVDTEQRIYQQLCTAGMGFLTVTHRPTLDAVHFQRLQLYGDGSWQLQDMSSSV